MGHHVRRPGAKILNAPDFDLRTVDVNPVVGEGIRMIKDQHDDKEVAIFEPFGGGANMFRWSRRDASDEVSKRHGRNELVSVYPLGPAWLLDIDRINPMTISI